MTYTIIEQQKMGYAAALHQSITNPGTHIVQRQANYSITPSPPPPAIPTFVPFSGTTSRFAIQHNVGGPGIGNIPYKITFHYRRIGNPIGNLSIGLRKAAGDTFQLIAQHPVIEPRRSEIMTATIEGFNQYQMVANDKVSIEFPPDASNTIELACGTGLPSGFTSQSYTGSYNATAAPLAITITSKVLVPI